MTASLTEFIQCVKQLVEQRDTLKFKWCITINPGIEEGAARSKYPEPNDFDLYPLPERVQDIIKSYLKLTKSVYINNNIEQSFADLDEMVNKLNRFAETQTNWINLALINACTELISVHSVLKDSTSKLKETKRVSNGELADESSLEKLASTINKLFKLSLNDKNLDISQSKRRDIYIFLGYLIKIYFKLGKLELALSVEKALHGTRFELPTIGPQMTSKRHVITYLYYSAILALDRSDFKAAEEKLSQAMTLASCYKEPRNVTKQIEKILLVLFPLKLLNKGVFPSADVWKNVPNIRFLYLENLFAAITEGDLKKYTDSLEKFKTILLKNHIYILFIHLKSLCYLRIIKKAVAIVNDLNSIDKPHIVPLSALQIAFTFSDTRAHDNSSSVGYDLDRVECVLANLISSGRMKGYISHSNKCVVLSKTNAFPKLFSKDN